MTTQKTNLYHLALAGVFAALITLFTAFFVHIPVGVNGGYVHLGDAIIYIAACILPTPYALAAAAIGGGLADLLTAPVWTVATVLIKMGLVLPFTSKGRKILEGRNLAAVWIAFVITCLGYYAAEVVLFGAGVAFLASVTGSVVQAAGSAVLFYALGAVLDRVGIKTLAVRHTEKAAARS